MIIVATHLTQLGPAQAQRKHARVSGSICDFLHRRLTRAAERECTRNRDVSKDFHNGDTAIHSATKDARSGISSAVARDFTAERECTRTTDVGEDIYRRSANTDARSGDASADARDVTQESVHWPRNLCVHPNSSLPAAQIKPRRLPAARSSSTKTHTDMAQLTAHAVATYAQMPAQCHI